MRSPRLPRMPLNSLLPMRLQPLQLPHYWLLKTTER